MTDTPYKRILVLRGGAIGDFVLTVPVFRALRKAFPGSSLALAGHDRTAPLARAGGLADETLSLESAFFAKLFQQEPGLTADERRRLSSFDLAICYLSDPDARVERNLADAGIRRVIRGSPLPEAMHAADHLLQPLRALGETPVIPACPRLTLGEEHRQAGLRRLDPFGSPVVMIHPGSGGERKNWAPEKFAALASQIQARTGRAAVFTAGEADALTAVALRKELPEANILPPLTLLETAQCLCACGQYVGNDSGITHLAASLGVPVVALFGPTDPALWGPRGAAVRIIRASEPTTQSLRAISVGRVLREVWAACGEFDSAANKAGSSRLPL